MPHRSNARGSLMIDLRFPPPVGRFRMASGVVTVAQHRRIVAQLRDIGARRLDLLVAVQQRRLPLAVLLTAHATDALDFAADPRILQPLDAAAARWLVQVPASPSHARAVRYSVGRLGPALPLRDLPDRVGELVAQLLRADHPRMAQLVVAHARGLARDILGPDHAVTQQLRRFARIRRPRVLRPEPWAPADAYHLFAAHADPIVRTAGLGMLLTGMNPSEYLGAWHVAPDRVVIDGTKRRGRGRWVPRLAHLPAPAPCALVTLRRHWRAAQVPGSPMMCRRTFLLALDDAGIPTPRQRFYAGHGAGSMTLHYQTGAVVRALRDDADRLDATFRTTGPVP